MPTGKRQKSNSMLYAMIGFVAMFVLATGLAAFFYVKAEDYRNREANLRRDTDELASQTERNTISSIVGAKVPQKTWIGSLADYHNKTILLLNGAPVDTSISADIKYSAAATKVETVLESAKQLLAPEVIDANTGLIQVVAKFNDAMENAANTVADVKEQMNQLQTKFDDAMQASQAKEKTLAEEKEKFYQQTVELSEKYEELKALMEQSSEERVNTLMTRLEQERTNARNLTVDLEYTQDRLLLTRKRLKKVTTKLQAIEPAPDHEAIVFEPDGKVILVDETAGLVHLNIGIQDRVYRGLTFAVYDEGTPIPKDGKGKGEVEVFDVTQNTSIARIINSIPSNPIIVDDQVANLIWDSSTSLRFLIVGQFDISGNGYPDSDAIDRISNLIKRWGGSIITTLSPHTDIVIIGDPPVVPREPSLAQQERNPMARGRYESAKAQLEEYNSVQEKARDLLIPMYTYDKFLYLIGYRGKSTEEDAF